LRQIRKGIRWTKNKSASQLKLLGAFFYLQKIFRTQLKNRILAQDRDGAELQTAGILLYVEDLKRGTNKDVGPKDIFELGSIL